jgi:hypothetical protein
MPGKGRTVVPVLPGGRVEHRRSLALSVRHAAVAPRALGSSTRHTLATRGPAGPATVRGLWQRASLTDARPISLAKSCRSSSGLFAVPHSHFHHRRDARGDGRVDPLPEFICLLKIRLFIHLGRHRVAPFAFPPILVTPLTPSDVFNPSRRPRWPHGDVQLHALGGMLAPAVFRAPGRPDSLPLHTAPRADEPGADRWPGAMRRRLHPPCNACHFALGLEPVSGAFDLGHVARARRDHPLAVRCGLELRPDSPCLIGSRLSARPSEASK